MPILEAFRQRRGEERVLGGFWGVGEVWEGREGVRAISVSRVGNFCNNFIFLQMITV